MIALVRVALRRPYTFIVLALAVLIIGPLAALRTPVDIFPDIRIPVVAIVWQYTGLEPELMAGRITSQSQRALTTTVNDIEHIEATSYNGLGIIKVFFQPGADIRLANAQITAISQTQLKQMPPNTTPPLILNYNASTVPIIQLGLSGSGLSEQALADIGLNTLRTPLVTVPGAGIPLPYGGKLRQVQIDLDARAMQARGLSGQDVANALAAQNLITPAGTEKIGSFEYAIQLNNAPSAIADLADLPIKSVNGAMVYIRDVAHVRDGNPPQTNIVHVDGSRSVLMQILKNGSVSTLAIIDGIKQKLTEIKDILPPNLKIAQIGDQSIFIKAAVNGVIREGVIAASLTALMILHFSRQLALDADYRHLHSAVGARFDRHAVGARRKPQHHDAGRTGARRRYSRRRCYGDHRKHQLSSRTGQGGRDRDPGRRRADRDARLRIAAVHLHRLCSDVLSARRGSISCLCQWPKP